VNLPSSATYTLAVFATQAATNTYAFELEETSVTGLTLGTAYQGTLAGSGQAQLFTVQVTGATTLEIALSDAVASDENEVYVSLGSLPTRDNYDFRDSSAGANQALALAAHPGTYDILVYSNLVSSPGSGYSLIASARSFVLAGLTTTEIDNTQGALLLQGASR
jgi:hypothetical protein